MLKLSIFIFIITQLLSNCPSVRCEENNDSSSLTKNIEDEIDLDSTDYVSFDKNTDENDPTKIVDFIDPHSLFYDRLSKKVIEDVETLPIKENKGIATLRRNSDDCDTLKVYYKRLILMLLSNANLKTEDDLVEGQLFIRGTYDQIETLKKLETTDYSMKEIDLILSEIILKTRYYNYMPNLSEIIFSLSNVLNYNVEIIVIATMIIAIVVLLRVMSLSHALAIMLVALFVVSFYMTWWHLMKEAEIKLAVEQVKYPEMPVACQPHKMGVWDTLKSFMFDNKDCEKYVEARMGNPKLGITPAVVLSHMFATIALHPVKLVGITISEFIDNATGHLHWTMKPIVQIIVYLCLPIYAIILVLGLKGGDIGLALGPFLRFNLATHKPTSVPDTSKRERIELIQEVLAEVSKNTPQSISQNTTSVPLPITNSIQEDNNSTDNLCKHQSTKLIFNESKNEKNCACGDSVQHDLLSEESKKTSEECVEANKTDAAKHIGSGDA